MTEPKIALVTGASRGAGAGVARGLGELGYTVYVTGRSVTGSTAKGWDGSPLPGTIGETAAEITKRGGKGIALPATMGMTRKSLVFLNKLWMSKAVWTFWSIMPRLCIRS